jgi:hypothetical protein
VFLVTYDLKPNKELAKQLSVLSEVRTEAKEKVYDLKIAIELTVFSVGHDLS